MEIVRVILTYTVVPVVSPVREWAQVEAPAPLPAEPVQVLR